MPTTMTVPESQSAALVAVDVSMPKTTGYAGEWFPMEIVVKRPDSWASPVRLFKISSKDKSVQIDSDLLDRNETIRPGERYLLSFRVNVSQPRLFALDDLELEVREVKEPPTQSEWVPLPAKKIDIQPAIGREIAITAASICQYDVGTKVEITLRHEGATTFRRLSVAVQPESAIRAGKPTLQLAEFRPGAEEKFELVVSAHEVDVHVSADVEDRRSAASRTLAISPPVSERRQFRFLEPRRLSVDTVLVFEKTADGAYPVGGDHGTYPLHSGCQYEVVIEHQGADEVRIRDVLGQVHVRDVQRDPKTGYWKQLIDVSMPDLFRKTETLFYDVEVGNETLTGEIAVCLKPATLRYWQVAVALGFALTVQGFVAVARFFNKIDFDFGDAVTSFSLRENFNVLFLLSIPVFWGVLKCFDWLLYRLRT